MKCKNCNKDIETESKFCQYCGAKVGSSNKQAEVVEVDKEFLDHLDYLGYDVEKKDKLGTGSQTYIAKHKNRINLFFFQSSELGVTFNTLFTLDRKKVEKNKLEVLELINKANADFIFGSNWLTDDLKGFCNTALYLGEYNKKRFAAFLDLLDSTTQRRNADMDYLKKFV